MNKRSRPARHSLRILQVVLLFLAAAGLAWLALAATGLRAFSRSTALVEWIDPENPRLFFSGEGRSLLNRPTSLNDTEKARIASALARQPLADQPFSVAATRALARGDEARGEALLLEARRRAPRDSYSRLFLLGLYLQSNRVREASLETSVLVQLAPQTSGLLVSELARRALQPRSSAAVVEAIGSGPLMAQVLLALAERGVEPATVMRLAARQPRPSNGDLAQWQRLVIGKIVERGDARAARHLWMQLVGVAPERDLPVYDPRFEKWPGTPPFNWAYPGSAVGTAEPTAGPALDVSFPGRQSGRLAEQLLVLAPGRYRFSVRAEGNATGDASSLAWRVLCREGATLLDLPVREITYTPRELAGEFTIPSAGCNAQWLRLDGIAGEFPTMQAVTFADLTLRPAGVAR